MKHSCVLACSLVIATACTEPDLSVSEVASASETANGASLNGASLNGASLNGASLNGASLNGASLNGASLNGASLNGASLDGASLDGSELESTNYSSLEGAVYVGTLSDGRSINLRIDDVSAGSGSNSDIYYYEISVQVDSGWLPLCEDASGANQPAIALAGRWGATAAKDRSPGNFTFACRGGALAKCVEYLGYKPWSSPALDSLHQTCTRVIRADYCGNGTSYTVNGRAINLYDGHGIQDDTELWGPEAEWDENGARCMTRQRVLDLGTGLPTCILEKENVACTLVPDWGQTLIVNEAYDILVEQ